MRMLRCRKSCSQRFSEGVTVVGIAREEIPTFATFRWDLSASSSAQCRWHYVLYRSMPVKVLQIRQVPPLMLHFQRLLLHRRLPLLPNSHCSHCLFLCCRHFLLLYRFPSCRRRQHWSGIELASCSHRILLALHPFNISWQFRFFSFLRGNFDSLVEQWIVLEDSWKRKNEVQTCESCGKGEAFSSPLTIHSNGTQEQRSKSSCRSSSS